MRVSITVIAYVIILSIVSCSTNVTLDTPDYKVFSRTRFDYESMDIVEVPDLSQEVQERLMEAYFHLERLNSSYSVQIVKKLIDTHERHPLIDGLYSYFLFENGKWLESIEIIDNAIADFGPHENLVYFRQNMAINMSFMGTDMRVVDGMTLFLPSSHALPYDNKQFQKESLFSALHDSLYLLSISDEKERLVLEIAEIHHILGNYETSNHFIIEYGLNLISPLAELMVARNHIKIGDYEVAEQILKSLLEDYPDWEDLYYTFDELYEEMGDEEQMLHYRNRRRFFAMVPGFLGLEYCDDFLSEIDFFNGHNSPQEKLRRYRNYIEGELDDLMNISVIILYCHENHGIGLEELIVETMIEVGEDAIPAMIGLFETPNISTCTITNCCIVFSNLKDPRGWDAMVGYLPTMVYLPDTLIAPAVAEHLIAYDEYKGAQEIVAVIKTFLLTDEEARQVKDDIIISFNFSKHRLFTALRDIPRETVIEIALNLHYSSNEIDLLLTKIYD